MTRPNINQLVDALRAEFTVRIELPTGAVEKEQLFVELPADHAGRARQLELVFLPDDDGVHFLQYFVALPYAIKQERLGDLARLINRINATSPLIGFGLIEDLPLACFRCVVPCPNRTLDTTILSHTLYVVLYIIDQLGAIVEAVGGGTVTLADAVAQLAAVPEHHV